MNPMEPSDEATILLAEDDQGVRRLCNAILVSHGYRVLAAKNGKHAMDVAEAHMGPIHLLLSDLMMPELDGPDLAEQLRAVLPDVRVIFMSAYGDGLAVSLRGCPFIQKPFRADALVKTVRDTLAQPPNPFRRAP